MEISTKGKLVPLILSIFVILADQISKMIIVARFPLTGGRDAVLKVFGGDFLWITHVRNKAIAFSLGHGLPDVARQILFILLPVVVLALLMVYYFRYNDFSRLQRWAVAGITGGGIGNIIDRIFRPEGVVDFISVNFYGLLGFTRWPTFNIADSAVVVCGILLFISILASGRKTRESLS